MKLSLGRGAEVRRKSWMNAVMGVGLLPVSGLLPTSGIWTSPEEITLETLEPVLRLPGDLQGDVPRDRGEQGVSYRFVRGHRKIYRGFQSV